MDTLLGLEVGGKFLVTSAPFLLMLPKNCQEVLDVKSPGDPPRDPKSKISMLSKEIQDPGSKIQNCQGVKIAKRS